MRYGTPSLPKGLARVCGCCEALQSGALRAGIPFGNVVDIPVTAQAAMKRPYTRLSDVEPQARALREHCAVSGQGANRVDKTRERARESDMDDLRGLVRELSLTVR